MTPNLKDRKPSCVNSLTAIMLLALSPAACVSDQQAQAPLSLHPHFNAARTQAVALAEPNTAFTATIVDPLVIPSPVPLDGPAAR